jgi:hypothetical protein
MGEQYSNHNQEQRESKRELDFNKLQRLKENLMKLEKSAIDEVDEATQSMRGSIQAMGFGITPVPQSDDDEQ